MKDNSPFWAFNWAGILPGLMVLFGVGEVKENPASKGTGAGLVGGLKLPCGK